MAIEKGSFILIDYVCRVKETGEVFDTTLEDVAKKEGIYREDTRYEPMLVVVGEGWVIRGLDEKLTELEVGETETLEIPPEKAFGHRDPTKMRMVPLRKFREQGITPAPGMQVEVDNRVGVVRSVSGGRVQVDFNPPLAGKTLVYEVTVKKVLEKDLDKIKALIHRRIPNIDIEKFLIKLGEKVVTIEMPPESFFVQGIQVAKRGLALDIQKYLPKFEEIRFVERIRRREEKEEEKAPTKRRRRAKKEAEEQPSQESGS